VSRSRTVSLALVGLFVWVTACTSYKQIEIGEVADHGKVRVTTTDGQKRVLYHTIVEADSLKGGPRHQPDPEYYDPLVYAIPLDQVSGIESVGTNEAATVLTVVGVTVAALVLVLAICPPFEEC
jgi:hypothetical protein